MVKFWFWFEAIGLVGLVNFTINFIITFYIAFANEQKALTITVNKYNEAIIESIVFGIWATMGIIAVIRIIGRKTKRKEYDYRYSESSR